MEYVQKKIVLKSLEHSAGKYVFIAEAFKTFLLIYCFGPARAAYKRDSLKMFC